MASTADSKAIKSVQGVSLAQAALFHEFLFERLQLLVEQVVCLVDQADGDVGNHLD